MIQLILNMSIIFPHGMQQLTNSFVVFTDIGQGTLPFYNCIS